MAQKANDEEKIYSLKTVQTEIARLQKSMDKKREKIENLTAELKADKSHMKELEKLADELQKSELKEKIAKVWFDEEKMTGEQIEKILELSRRIHDKLDVLDVRILRRKRNPDCRKEVILWKILRLRSINSGVAP